MTQINLFMKQKQNQGHREQSGSFQREGGWEKEGYEKECTDMYN